MANALVRTILIAALLILPAFTLLTSGMVRRRLGKKPELVKSREGGPVLGTSCNRLDLSQVYNYSGIAASGYL